MIKIKIKKLANESKSKLSKLDTVIGSSPDTFEYMYTAGGNRGALSTNYRMEENSCGCSRCQQGMEYDEYGKSSGPADSDDDGIISACELKHHFDLNSDGQVTPDEYDAHVNWHCEHPDVLNGMMDDYENIQDDDEYYEFDDDVIHTFYEALSEKKDRCYHLAKQKYDVFPSAYASGFIVRCRKGKVGRKKKK
jgi:hypothetical protein